MQKFIPQWDSIVKIADLSQEEREKNKGNNAKIQHEWQIHATAFLKKSGHEHQEKNNDRAYGRLPIALPQKNARRHQDQHSHTVVQHKGAFVSVIIFKVGRTHECKLTIGEEYAFGKAFFC